jgi:uncharacterized SAM-binding protein YcdF (DUF218 family)
MADYLISKGTPNNRILKEGYSKDTISNLYYLKQQILLPKDMKRLLFVVAEFRVPRLKYLCKRILGNGYFVNFETVPSKLNTDSHEQHIFELQEEFLAPMKNGDHRWLDGKFYTAPIYRA